MRALRILFMGTPDFAVETLKAILAENFNVVGVITAPDKPAGRGRQLNESAVKKFAVSKGLHVLQPTNLKAEDLQREIEELDPNVAVVVAFRMLPQWLWKFPEYGTFNLHASLLPEYRGAAPINWAMMNGEKRTGITTFFIDDKIDTGNTILQQEVKIEHHENVGHLHDKLMRKGALLVIKTLNQIRKNTVKAIPQEQSSTLKNAPKLDKENTKIDWNQPLEDINNHIRGLNPYPGAWCYLENSAEEFKVKIFDVEMLNQAHHLPNGTVTVQDKKIKVAAKNGFIQIKELQLPGKKRLNAKDLLNGYHFAPDSKLR